VHVLHPVAEAVDDQPADHGVVAVQRVADPAVVDVRGPVVGGEQVVRVVGDAAQRERRAVGAVLGGVVVDHVEDHLDAGPVERLDQVAELVTGPSNCGRSCSRGGGRRTRPARSPSSWGGRRAPSTGRTGTPGSSSTTSTRAAGGTGSSRSARRRCRALLRRKPELGCG
jgi:hypothetical protein